ncbi:MAG: hypothetical protein ACREHD_12290, partial [Pirellulales bacterium]
MAESNKPHLNPAFDAWARDYANALLVSAAQTASLYPVNELDRIERERSPDLSEAYVRAKCCIFDVSMLDTIARHCVKPEDAERHYHLALCWNDLTDFLSTQPVGLVREETTNAAPAVVGQPRERPERIRVAKLWCSIADALPRVFNAMRAVGGELDAAASGVVAVGGIAASNAHLAAATLLGS